MFSSQRALTFAKKATLTFVSQSSIATLASTFFSSKFFSQPYAQAFAQAQAITTSFSLAQLRQQPNSHANCRAAGNDYASRASGSRSYNCFADKFTNKSKRKCDHVCTETGQAIATRQYSSLNEIRTLRIDNKQIFTSANFLYLCICQIFICSLTHTLVTLLSNEQFTTMLTNLSRVQLYMHFTL